MFGGMSIGQMFKWGGIILLVLLIIGAWARYNSVVNERDLLAQNVTALKSALETEKKANATYKTLLDESFKRFEDLQVTMANMAKAQQDSRKELEALNGKFRNHDLAELALKKPGLIENRINSGTSDTFRMLEQASEPVTNGSNSE